MGHASAIHTCFSPNDTSDLRTFICTETYIALPNDCIYTRRSCIENRFILVATELSSCCLLVISTIGKDCFAVCAEILLESLTAHVNRITILQNEEHPRPLGGTWVPPGMFGSPLDGDIARLEKSGASIVKLHDDFAGEDDPVVETLGAMHDRLVVGTDIHEAANGTVWLDNGQVTGILKVLVQLHVDIFAQLRRHAVCRVDEMMTCIESGVVFAGRCIGAQNLSRAVCIVRGDVDSGICQVGLWINPVDYGHDLKCDCNCVGI